MSKTPRNVLCPCGSQKKHKHCCGSSRRGSLGSVVPAAANEGQEPRAKFDPRIHPSPVLHGHYSPHSVTTTCVYAEPVAGIGCEPRPEGYPGEYEIEFTLQAPARLGIDDGILNVDPDMPGSSLLAILKPEPRTQTDASMIQLRIGGPGDNLADQSTWRIYDLLPNPEGYLSTIKTRCTSTDSLAAEETAFERLKPLLDRIAFAHDVPTRTRVLESKTGTVRVIYHYPPYLRVGFVPASTQKPFDKEKSRVLWFYHEALRALSPIYQYLCYYKVIELVFGLRIERIAKAKAEGMQPRIESERLHRTPWLTMHVTDGGLLKSVEGRKFTAIHDDHLRPVRHRVAHAFLDASPSPQVDEKELEPEVIRYLPLVHHIARCLAGAEAELVLPHT